MKAVVFIATFLSHLLSLSNALLSPQGKFNVEHSHNIIGGGRSKYQGCNLLLHPFPLQAPPSGMQTLSSLRMMKKNNGEDDEKESNSSTLMAWVEKVKSKPANVIIAPFVAIFFIDIVANILVVTKRTIEYTLTGEYTVWHF